MLNNIVKCYNEYPIMDASRIILMTRTSNTTYSIKIRWDIDCDVWYRMSLDRSHVPPTWSWHSQQTNFKPLYRGGELIIVTLSISARVCPQSTLIFLDYAGENPQRGQIQKIKQNEEKKPVVDFLHQQRQIQQLEQTEEKNAC